MFFCKIKERIYQVSKNTISELFEIDVLTYLFAEWEIKPYAKCLRKRKFLEDI